MTSKSMLEAICDLPENWRDAGTLSWPGYVNGALVANFRADLHHGLSSGGGPRVYGIGETPIEAMEDAAANARGWEAYHSQEGKP